MTDFCLGQVGVLRLHTQLYLAYTYSLGMKALLRFFLQGQRKFEASMEKVTNDIEEKKTVGKVKKETNTFQAVLALAWLRILMIL